jgi:hypothetical protein
MSSLSKVKNNIINEISSSYPGVTFVKSDGFKWDAKSKQVHYAPLSSESDIWSLFHELGHMLLDHADYNYDFELLKMEVLAWQKAKLVAKDYGVNISQEHIEKCIDSYRDWLHERSKCRQCEQTGLEKNPGIYSCFNCGFTWKVTPARFCRVYRKKIEP